MSEYKVTIVVPVYNVENYIDKCLNTIINQSYNNLEIIIVNDGSTDSSVKICENYLNLDNRIKLFNKKNGGLSDARNFGIKQSTGDFITFIDSDDYISLNYIEELIVNLKKNNSDIAISGVGYVKNEVVLYEGSNSINKYNSEDSIDNMHKKIISIPFSTSWGKLVPIDFFKNEKFPKDRLHEDEYITYKLYIYYKNIVFIDKPLYYYRIRNNSIMNVKKTTKNLMVLDAFYERINLLQKNKFSIKRNLISYYKTIFMYKNILSKSELKNYSKYIEYHLNFVNLKLKKQDLSFKEKMKLLFFKYFGKYYFNRSL